MNETPSARKTVMMQGPADAFEGPDFGSNRTQPSSTIMSVDKNPI